MDDGRALDRYNPREIREAFYSSAGMDALPRQVRLVHVASDIYQQYLTIYQRSRTLVHALEKVLHNDEHRRLLIIGRLIEYKLPDTEEFAGNLARLKNLLANFNPYDIEHRHNGDIKVPLANARRLDHMLMLNCDTLSDLLTGIYNTQYMMNFRRLNEAGNPYTGPVAMQEIQNLMTSLSCLRTLFANPPGSKRAAATQIGLCA